MKLFIAVVLFAAACFAASDAASAAAKLAKEAEKSENAGQLVRAYLLYTAAAIKDPKTPDYAVKREALAPRARLLMQAGVMGAGRMGAKAGSSDDVSADIKNAESNAAPIEPQPRSEAEFLSNPTPAESLQPPPHLVLNGSIHDFDLRLDDKTAISQIAQAYGIEAVFDPGFDTRPLGHFQIDHADFAAAMDALTQVTGTFVFPLSPQRIFVARDTEIKRDEFEPVVLLTVPVPDSVEPSEILEAATAVRGALSLKAISWDSVGRNLVIRDRVTKARIAASLVAAIILPKAQISVEIQIVALDSDVSYHYGLGLPTSFPNYNLTHIGAFGSILPDLTNVSALLVLGKAGSNFFGLAIGNATLFATYSKSSSRVLYDATVAVSDGKTASFHVGEQYPIPTSLYSGFAQSTPSIYNPIGQVQMEDLGIILKVGARAHGDGDISLDLEAAYKALGTTIINTVPSIAQREFKGSVRLRQDEYAIIAGMDSDQRSSSRNGLAGIASLPGINQALAENTRDHAKSDTLILIKPTVTRLPISPTISPQYLLGSLRGTRVSM